MSFKINADLSAFSTFAANASNPDAIAEMKRSGNVVAAETTASAFSRKFSNSANTQAAKTLNNNTRQILVDALKRQFNVARFNDLPEAVRTALRGTHASTDAEDFGFAGGDDTVTSGKPLTARRIRAVITAVKEVMPNEDHPRIEVTTDIITRRETALEPFLNELHRKLTTPVQPWGVAIVGSRYVNVATKVVHGNIKRLLAQTGKSDYPRSKARRDFVILSDAMGVVPDYWNHAKKDNNGNPTPGLAVRNRYYEQFFNELVNDFNAAHPELAL